MKPKISLITLGVLNIARSLKFYRDGLGFPVHRYKEGDEAVFFKLEGSWLSICPREKLAQDACIPSAGTGFSGITLAHNVLSKREVDQVFDHAVLSGGKSIKKPEDVFWGGYSGYFSDPDGHLWEVAWNPFTDLT